MTIRGDEQNFIPSTRVTQQSLEVINGIEELQRRLCAPTALYDTAVRAGYQIDPAAYAQNLDLAGFNTSVGGWSRAHLSDQLRNYGVSVVSWKLGSTGQTIDGDDRAKMIDAGYMRTEQEQSFFDENIATHPDILSIVDTLGTPAVVTVKPQFAMNQRKHAITIHEFNSDLDLVTIVDPDARNSDTVYTGTYVRHFLDQDGAASIILPPEVKALPK